MAFIRTELIPVSSQAIAPRLWMYNTPDAIATVIAAGYFNDAKDVLKVNDIMFTVTSIAGTPAHNIHIVNQNDGTVVDVTNGTVIAATDTT